MSPNTHLKEEIMTDVDTGQFYFNNVKDIVDKNQRKRDDNGNITEFDKTEETAELEDISGSFSKSLYGLTSQPIKWRNIIVLGLIHLYGFYAMYASYNSQVQWKTILFEIFLALCVGFGVTGGAHRYFSHRSYKAKFPVRLFLVWCFTTAGQNSILEWVKDHKVHHKYVDTNADPHNASRGFFFAHVGWLLMRKHPDVINKGKKIDVNDVLEDPIVRFHQKHFQKLKLLFCFILPTVLPMTLWNETFSNSFNLVMIRMVFTLHTTWSVNSFAHLYGWRPYNKTIRPVENWFVSLVALGEGWHNFHHTFPWDYKASEHNFLNFTTHVINLFAKMGLVYERKQVSEKFIKSALLKYGDGSHFKWGHQEIAETEFEQGGKPVFYH